MSVRRCRIGFWLKSALIYEHGATYRNTVVRIATSFRGRRLRAAIPFIKTHQEFTADFNHRPCRLWPNEEIMGGNQTRCDLSRWRICPSQIDNFPSHPNKLSCFQPLRLACLKCFVSIGWSKSLHRSVLTHDLKSHVWTRHLIREKQLITFLNVNEIVFHDSYFPIFSPNTKYNLKITI